MTCSVNGTAAALVFAGLGITVAGVLVYIATDGPDPGRPVVRLLADSPCGWFPGEPGSIRL